MSETELYGYEEDEILVLELETGEEVRCGIMGLFEASGKTYIALNPLGTGEVYIFGYEDRGEEFELFDDLTEEEFEDAVSVFEKLTKAKLVKESSTQG